MSDTQSQKAGRGSHLVQVSGDLVQGITLDQALEVAKITAHAVVAQEFAKAEDLAMRRVELLNSRVIAQLDDLERLTALADPAFQVSLRRAQVGAACTDKESDYDMLAQLLADRATRGEERKVRAGLDLAIGIVDRIDEDALAGLTVLQAATQFRPISGTVRIALGTLDKLYGQLLVSDLPAGEEWLDHLDILGAVRISQLGGLKKYDQFFPAFVPGLVAPGIESDSEANQSASRELAAIHPNLAPIDHDLKPGFQRIPFGDLPFLEEALRPLITVPENLEIAMRIARDTYGLGTQDETLREPLMSMISEFPNVSRVRSWWDAIPQGIQVTAAGRVLARANAKRCDTLGMLPPLD